MEFFTYSYAGVNYSPIDFNETTMLCMPNCQISSHYDQAGICVNQAVGIQLPSVRTSETISSIYVHESSSIESNLSPEQSNYGMECQEPLDYNVTSLVDCLLNAFTLDRFDPIRSFWSIFNDKITILAIPIIELNKDVYTSGLEQLFAIFGQTSEIYHISRVSHEKIELIVDLKHYPDICKTLDEVGWTVIIAESPESICADIYAPRNQKILNLKRRYLEEMLTTTNSDVASYYNNCYNFLQILA